MLNYTTRAPRMHSPWLRSRFIYNSMHDDESYQAHHIDLDSMHETFSWPLKGHCLSFDINKAVYCWDELSQTYIENCRCIVWWLPRRLCSHLWPSVLPGRLWALGHHFVSCNMYLDLCTLSGCSVLRFSITEWTKRSHFLCSGTYYIISFMCYYFRFAHWKIFYW